MRTWPLESISIEEAMEKQFQLIDEITKVFPGNEILTRGDLGVVKGLNQPISTNRVEQVLTNFFHAESAMLVRGSGTMAIRLGLHSMLNYGDTLLVHKAPIYPTTKTTIEMLGLSIVEADYNDLHSLSETLNKEKIDGVLLQISRQKIEDSYHAKDVIETVRKVVKEVPILTDDNYTVLKTKQTGNEMGANLSSFSTFKLLGPEGVGCIVGDNKYISKIRSENYSGGLQVQGYEAIDVLRGMIYAPVELAISANVADEVAKRLIAGEITGVKDAYVANAQSKVILVELEKENADEVLSNAEKLGAAPIPVGSESQYEFVPMFYRISGTFRAADPTAEKRMIRINPMRSGADTIIRILNKAING